MRLFKAMMETNHHIKDLGILHIDSFNYVVDEGLRTLINEVEPLYIKPQESTSDYPEIKISIANAEMKQLQYPMDLRKNKRTVYPSEARMRTSTYLCELHLELCFYIEDDETSDEVYCTRIFYLPLMVKSKLCYLHGFSAKELIKVKEEINDPGGYFIINGNERLLRNFTVPRRNYPLALFNKKWKKGKYSAYGIFTRSVKNQHTFSNNSLHYVTDGTYEMRLYHNGYPYHIPVMLVMKSLLDICDYRICKEICKYNKEFRLNQLKHMLRTLQTHNICSHMDAKNYIGMMFIGFVNLPPNSTYQDAADFILKKSVLVHLDDYHDKFEFLCLSLGKLHSVIENKCRLDDLDNPAYQEILTSGQTYLIALKLGIRKFLQSVKNGVNKSVKDGKLKFEKVYMQKLINRAICFSCDMRSLIARGNLPGKRWHGLPVETGFSIALKRTNIFELAAQFNAVCKFSMEHYGKNIRKYYPESWGFLCPTQTPEGENIGLHNQLAMQCQILPLSAEKIDIRSLQNLGVLSNADPAIHTSSLKYFVIVDGLIIGWIYGALAKRFLLKLKNKRSNNQIPFHTEIVMLTEDQCLFPSICLFSTPCRLIRKIMKNSNEETIGILEQALGGKIYVYPNESQDGEVDSYSECRATNFLSLSAAMIPFCEYNPAVRNIFSSVKCKQAIGAPLWNLPARSDSKIQHLVYSQSPVVMTHEYAENGYQDYPYGTNVIAAVISYSGFDMEDALVLNKSSVERGLMENMLYKTEYYDFEDLANEANCKVTDMIFKIDKNDPYISYFLDERGLPYVGALVKYNDPIISIYNAKSKKFFYKHYLERYRAHIYSVKLSDDVPCSTKNIPKTPKKIVITFCVKRAPKAGDKFSNRHGGKGVCGSLLPSEDMPFSASGMVPDVLFNPHGLPTRMSIGMLYEMMAAKASLQKGCKYSVETFPRDKSIKIYESLGEALTEAGFEYYGTEKFYSGTSGQELEADIFCGSLYYLRLHHIVEEKYQVRSVGPVDDRTLQPINPGKSGAIRCGEMEKDAILSHGTIEILMDRLLYNSDQCYAYLCQQCHTVLYPILQSPIPEERERNVKENKFCHLCQKESQYKIRIPYVLIYLMAELLVMNIKVKLLHE